MLDAQDYSHADSRPREVRPTVRVASGSETAHRTGARRDRRSPPTRQQAIASIRAPAYLSDASVRVALLKLDPDLAEAVSSADRNRARGAVQACAYRLAAGRVSIPMADMPSTTFALLVLRGALVHETQVGQGRMVEFISRGDLLMPFHPQPDGAHGRVALTATEDVLLAALDHQFIRAAAVWPGLMISVQRRLCEQQHRLAVHGAICQLPRIEQRLMALMWHLVDRAGKVTPDGVVLTRRLTHQALAGLVSAHRPSVTVALKALQNQDLLRRCPNGMWLLPKRDPASLAIFDDVIRPLDAAADMPAGASAHGAAAPSAGHGNAAKR